MHNVTPNQVILIAEDSDDDYEITMHALKKAGNLLNPVVRCENGQELLDYLRKESDEQLQADSVGIILLDLNMPGIDGRAALKAIKSDESLKDIPVIVLTTSNDERDIKDCYAEGANTYIQKPVDLDGFLDAIKRLKEYWFQIAILPRV